MHPMRRFLRRFGAAGRVSSHSAIRGRARTIRCERVTKGGAACSTTTPVLNWTAFSGRWHAKRAIVPARPARLALGDPLPDERRALPDADELEGGGATPQDREGSAQQHTA